MPVSTFTGPSPRTLELLTAREILTLSPRFAFCRRRELKLLRPQHKGQNSMREAVGVCSQTHKQESEGNLPISCDHRIISVERDLWRSGPATVNGCLGSAASWKRAGKPASSLLALSPKTQPSQFANDIFSCFNGTRMLLQK